MQLLNHIQHLEAFETPYYYYDIDHLRKTLDALTHAASRYGYTIHYALKANTDDRVLQVIRKAGLGADCVSGNEVRKALETGFDPDLVFFAGVGKTDSEIRTGIEGRIGCFNCESLEEMEVLNQLAAEVDREIPVAFRINPDVRSDTHQYITTGSRDNKFGIQAWELETALDLIPRLTYLKLVGLHVHVGSQIIDMGVFRNLCQKVHELNRFILDRGFRISIINLGGGLGIDYHQPDRHSIPDFNAYFRLIHSSLKPESWQTVHFEPGRSIVGHMGSLIGRVLYVKKGTERDFVILDAGMTELIRPALYGSYHQINNLSKAGRPLQTGRLYDVVGPICETADFLGKGISLPVTERNDLIVIRSVGAYGQSMSSNYNLRSPARVVYSDDLRSRSIPGQHRESGRNEATGVNR
jgi:diaminopimelate decarboxylase